MRPYLTTTGRRVARDRWMISYADMITLLFACFAALYAASVVPPGAAAAAETPAPAAAHTAAPTAPTPDADTQLTLVGDIQAAVDRVDGVSGVQVIADARGIVVSLPEAGAFASGDADLSQAARRVIRRLADVLSKETGEIRIEGHTDNSPIATSQYASNWELSAARATQVIRFLISQGNIAPERLSAAGYGEFRPLAPNDTPESRARNRRVDIFVVK